MKISEIVAEVLHEFGVRQVFGVSGGASLHLLKSINDHSELSLTCLHHEQSVAMAAEAYSRVSNNLGVGVVTSGPGATNLITGLAGAYYDSIPVLYITGQVSTSRMKRMQKVRQIGFQETPIVEMVKSVTKYAKTIEYAKDVEVELRKAIGIALSGRKGPVLIDIPDDVQRLEFQLNPHGLSRFLGDVEKSQRALRLSSFRENLKKSSRPILVCGAGIQLTSKRELLVSKLYQLSLPVALTWGAKDLLPSDTEFLLGTFGTHGERHVNIALNEADLIISIGSRLDLKATGTPISTFAPKAKKIMIDVDEAEISKFDRTGLEITTSISIDIESDDFDSLLKELEFEESMVVDWKKHLREFKSNFPRENRTFLGPGVNPYQFLEALSDFVVDPLNLIVDTGCAIAWTMQSWKTKNNQRIFHDFNNTAMGWSIPATIASVLSNPEKMHFCVVGDGSIMMALSDLVTLSNLESTIKIIVLNNLGYGMIRQTQDQWFDGEYFASSAQTDLAFPDFSKLASAMGFDYFSVESDAVVDDIIQRALLSRSPLLLEVFIQESARVIPIVKFGNPNHVMEPGLDLSRLD